MKKILVMLLVASMSFSLAACGDNSEVEKYKKYETLIAYMEAEDYESALAEVVEMSNGSVSIDNTSDIEDVAEEEVFEEEELEEEELEEEEPEVEAIEITLDNWQDYFEMREYHEFEENGFGEIDGVYIGYYLVSKDGIICDTDKSDVTFEYTCNDEEKSYTVDCENKTIIYGETTATHTFGPMVETMGPIGQVVGEDRNNRYGASLEGGNPTGALKSMVYEVVDIEITRIAGTFYVGK